MHVIRLDDAPHTLSCDVSSWFWPRDQLRSMLRQRQADVARQVLNHDDHEELFAELKM